jgi:hypothetical protein
VDSFTNKGLQLNQEGGNVHRMMMDQMLKDLGQVLATNTTQHIHSLVVEHKENEIEAQTEDESRLSVSGEKHQGIFGEESRHSRYE